MGLTQSFLGIKPLSEDCHSSAPKQLDLSESKAFSSGNFVRTQGGLFFAVSSTQWREWELASSFEDVLSKVLAIPNTYKLRSADGTAVITIIDRDELLELRKSHGVRLPSDYFGKDVVVSQVIAFIKHCDSEQASHQSSPAEDVEFSPLGRKASSQSGHTENGDDTDSSVATSDSTEEAENEEPPERKHHGVQEKPWWRTLNWWGRKKTRCPAENCVEDGESDEEDEESDKNDGESNSDSSRELKGENDNRSSCSSDNGSGTSESHLASDLDELSSSPERSINGEDESEGAYQDVVSENEDDGAPKLPEYGKIGRLGHQSPPPAASIILRRRLRDSLGDENIQAGKEQEMLKTLLDLHPSTQIGLEESGLLKNGISTIQQANTPHVGNGWRNSVQSANRGQKPIRRVVGSVQRKAGAANLGLDSDSDKEKAPPPPPPGRLSALISKSQPLVNKEEKGDGKLPEMWSNFVVASDEEVENGHSNNQQDPPDIASELYNRRTPKKSAIRSSARNKADEIQESAARVTRSGRCRY